MTDPELESPSWYPFATVGLVVLDLVAATTLGRLFTSPSALWPILIAVVGGHAVALLARVRNWSGAATVAAAFAAGILLGAWLVFPETTFYGLPGLDSWRAATAGLADARQNFGVIIAPTLATPGFRLACVFAVATFAAIADWGAFRVGVTIEAAVPAFTLFVFSAVLSTAQYRAPAALAFAAALAGWLVVHNAEVAAREKPWFAGTRSAGRDAIVRGGAGLGAVAVLGAGVGLILPFTSEPPAVAWREQRNEPRTTVSPLVDIRSRLVQRGDGEVFTVDSPVRAYWRLTSLDLFDGRIWSSRTSYREIKSGRAVPAARLPGENVPQRYTIGRLSSIWLPAAYSPATAPTAADLSFDAPSSSFITAEPTSDGLTYDVTSSVATPTADALRGSAPFGPDRTGSQLDLPALDPRIAKLATDITSRHASGYDKALALQQFFRSSRFTYDLRVPPGHGGDDLKNFLFNSRRGYCEQFAGSYAVLARLAGLPARVAVGFTAGEADKAVPNRFRVREINAHAWPEVFLGQAGWVAFEPTPGRGIPGGEGYTGVPEAQANPTQPSTATTAVPTTAAPVPSIVTAPPATIPPPAPAKSRLWSTLIIAAVAALLAGGAYAGAVPTVVALRRRSRRRAASAPEDAVGLAWAEAGEALAAAGHRGRPGATPAQVAAGAACLVGAEAPRLSRLANAAVVAIYAPPRLDAEDARRARTDADAVTTAALGTLSRRQRLGRALDPRRLRAR